MTDFNVRTAQHYRPRLRLAASLGVVLGGLLCTSLSLAESYAPDTHPPVFTTTYSAVSTISGNAFSGASGAINVNIAAGDHNLQSNSGAIAIGGNALANNIVVQQIKANNSLAPDRSSVQIRDNALSHASGWISINQAAGTQNVQSNTMSVALGVRGSSLTSANLSQVTSGGNGQELDPETGSSSRRDVEVDASAFRGTTGVVQVNQSAGIGNATRNNFSLRVGPN